MTGVDIREYYHIIHVMYDVIVIPIQINTLTLIDNL
jgi:hypothetical protein